MPQLGITSGRGVSSGASFVPLAFIYSAEVIGATSAVRSDKPGSTLPTPAPATPAPAPLKAPFDPSAPPPTSQQLRAEARDAAIIDTFKGVAIFGALATTAGLVIFPRSKEAAEVVAKDVSGFELKPVGSGRRAIPTLGKVSLLGFLPAPIGFVPPETYGLSPNFLITDELRKDPDKQRTIGVTIISFIGGNPGGERQAYYDAKEADRVRDQFAAVLPRLTTVAVQESFISGRPAGLVNDVEVRRAEEIRALALAELLRRGQTVPAIPGVVVVSVPIPTPANPIALPVASGSLQPAKIRPINAKAIANENNAEHLRRELVHERADP